MSRNILIIDDEWPEIYSGKAIRILNIYKRMRQWCNPHFLYIGNQNAKNMELYKDIFCSVNCVHVSAETSIIKRITNAIRFLPGEYKTLKNTSNQRIESEIKELIGKLNIDLLHIFSYFTAQYAENIQIAKIWDVGDSFALALWREIAGKALVNKLRTLYYILKIYRYESRMISKYDKTIFVGIKDFKVHYAAEKKISLISNGIDHDYYRENQSDHKIENSLIFTGHMKFKPNHDAIKFFLNDLYPAIIKKEPSTQLFIVGAEPPADLVALNGKNGITVTGYVDDIRSYINRAAIFIAPLINGSGIKNKILQAMSMSLPVISTKLGAEALNVTSDEVIIVNTKEEFINAVTSLLTDKNKRENLGKMARKKIENEYSWDKTVFSYENLFLDIKRIHDKQ